MQCLHLRFKEATHARPFFLFCAANPTDRYWQHFEENWLQNLGNILSFIYISELYAW